MSIAKLTEAEVQARLADLPSWSVQYGKLHKTFQFADFVHAFAFMTKGAFAAEALGHHPEWFNVYNRVVIDLTTHDAGGISVKDFELARRLDELA